MATDNDVQTVKIDVQTDKLTSTNKVSLLTQIKQKIDEGYIPLGGFETIITESSDKPAPDYENEFTFPPPMITTQRSTTYTQLMYKPTKHLSGGGNYKKKTKTHKRKY